MIMTLDKRHFKNFPGLKSAIFRLREEWFTPEAGPARVKELSRDILDENFATHLLSLTSRGEVIGAARIMQTTGPHMLTEAHTDLLDVEYPIRNPGVWEVSRVCVSDALPIEGDGQSQVRILAEMVLGVIEMALQSGVSTCVLISGIRTEAAFHAVGLIDSEVIVRTKVKQGLDLSVTAFDCNQPTADFLRSKWGFDGNIWLDKIAEEEPVENPERDIAQEMAQLLTAAMRGQSPADFEEKLRLYCAQQLMEAQTEEERDQARLLMSALGRILRESRSGSDDNG